MRSRTWNDEGEDDDPGETLEARKPLARPSPVGLDGQSSLIVITCMDE